MDEIRIRRYRDSDREQVRSICCATGYMGESIDAFWRDGESFADVFTRYYTDVEPGSLYVANSGGKVGGYLFGCLDSQRAANVKATAARLVATRGLLFRRGTAGFFWRSAFDVVSDALRRSAWPPEASSDPRWPAHLHINLLPTLRGMGGGAALMDVWLERLRREGVPGVHLSTYAENQNGIGFFERVGFERLGPARLVPGFRTREGSRMRQQIMVQSL